MFTMKKTTEPTDLDRAIADVHRSMRTVSADSEEYAKMVVQLAALTKLKEQEAPKRVSADTKAIVIANLAGILMILTYEHTRVVTTKAIGFIAKLR